MQQASALALAGLRLFLALLLVALAASPDAPPSKLFLARHGRSHRWAGAGHLAWLVVGAAWLVRGGAEDAGGNARWAYTCLAYDVVLGILGVAATLTAARSFPHKRVANRPGESGTLSREAMVTQGEMVEHAFYQALNLWQALYLHTITWMGGTMLRTTAVGRLMLLWIVTLPWASRRLFPVHSFSANWTNKGETKQNNNQSIKVGTEMGEKGLSSINRMYQVKKWQYVFYKHVILHGLNISMAFPRHAPDDDEPPPLPLTFEWRVFWLALNTSYVMEFFLQSIVKRGVISQRYMMGLNGLLMASASAAAAPVLGVVRVEAALVSLLLNFINRGHDICNTLVVGCLAACLR